MPKADYRMADDSKQLMEFITTAVANFRKKGFSEPINAIELAYWLEGSRLGVFFVHQEDDYSCYGQQAYKSGELFRREGSTDVSYMEFFDVARWEDLYQLTTWDEEEAEEGETEPILLDHHGKQQEGFRTFSECIGEQLFELVTKSYKNLFGGLNVTDPHWLSVFEDCDNDEWIFARVSKGKISRYEKSEVEFSEEWIREELDRHK